MNLYDLSQKSKKKQQQLIKEHRLAEFAPPGDGDGGDDGFDDEMLKRLAAQWWNGDEDPRVERTLAAAGWEIGQDEGSYDNGGAFVVQAGDVNGDSYMSWPAEELEQGVAEGSANGMRLLAKYEEGQRAVKVYKNAEWNEYVVQYYDNGQRNPEADYHTDDKQDAINSASSYLKKGTQGMIEGDNKTVHRIGLTVTDPNHPMVSKRDETIQKTVRVPGEDPAKAINAAIAHYRRKGYKVHDHHYMGTMDEAADNGISKGDETKFHAKLDTLVHDTFGKRKDEQSMAEGLGYSQDPDQAKWYHAGRKAYKFGTTGNLIQDIAKKHGCPPEWLKAFHAGYQDQEGWGKQDVEEAGYNHGFPDPNAPSLNRRRREDDEGHSEFDDRQRRQTGMIFYTVDDAERAQQLGLKQTARGKWFLRTGNRLAQQVADKEFGVGRIWYPKNETVESEELGELSNELLGRYKKELGVRASAADRAGDYDKGHEYFKKINRATIRQGDNDARRHAEKENDMMETRLNMMRKAGYDL